MSLRRPEVSCQDFAFRAVYRLEAPAEVALEDYARTLFEGRAAEAIPAKEGPPQFSGVHVCGVEGVVSIGLLEDLEAFARDLASRGREGGGLGWS
jgi:hypothetical protein